MSDLQKVLEHLAVSKEQWTVHVGVYRNGAIRRTSGHTWNNCPVASAGLVLSNASALHFHRDIAVGADLPFFRLEGKHNVNACGARMLMLETLGLEY